MKTEKKHISDSVKVLIGLITGVLLGIIFKEKIAVIGFIGDLYLKLIKMLVMPLVLCTIISAVSAIDSAAKLGRIGLKTVLIFIGNAALAACLGVLTATILHMGSGLDLSEEISTIEAIQAPSISEVLDSMVTGNIFEALTNFQTLPVIIFAVFFGIAIIKVGEKGTAIKEVVDSTVDVLFGIIAIIMKATPIGVCCLIARTIGEHGGEAFGLMGEWVLGGYCANLLTQVVYIILVALIAHVPFKKFFKAYSKTWIQAVSTRSSAATLPTNLNAAKELDISSEISEFTLPLGVTINMSGTCIGLAMYIVMASNAYGFSLKLSDLIIGILLVVVAGIGMSGVPNQGIIFYTMLGNVFGFPLTLGGMIFGVDSLNDMIATASNTCGDLAAAAIVARSEDAIKDDYASSKAGQA